MEDVVPIQGFSLRELGLVDGEDEPAFDNLTSLACAVLGCPVSLVSLVQTELDRQYFKSQVGLPEPVASVRQTPLSHSFCKHVVATDETLVVENAPEHPLVSSNLAIDALGVTAYLGAPFHNERGFPVGALCVIDSVPRSWSSDNVQQLEQLASCVTDAIRLKAESLASTRLADQLSMTTARLNDAVSAGGVGLWERNLNTGEVWLSDAFAELHGVQTHTWSSLNEWLALFHLDDRAQLEPLIHAEREPNKVYEWIYRVGTGCGSYRWLRSTSCLSIGQDGVSRQSGAAVDISGEREREAEIFALNEDLRETNQDLDEFVRTASHDLRSPLRGIRSLVAMLEEDLGDIPEHAHAHMMKIDRRVTRLQQLLDDLLAYTRAGTDAQRVERANPIELTQNVFDMFDCPDTITLEVESDTESIVVNSAALKTCIRNLVDNAIKHSVAAGLGGAVRVRFERTSAGLTISVSDEGPGIPEDLLEKVFEPFRTLQPRDKVEGSGIGLSIVQRAISREGGAIEVESTVGSGSTFRMFWPEGLLVAGACS